jgi:hypothetical protein
MNRWCKRTEPVEPGPFAGASLGDLRRAAAEVQQSLSGRLSAMQFNEDPTPDEEEVLRCMDPAVLESYRQLKTGLRDALREIERQQRNRVWQGTIKAMESGVRGSNATWATLAAIATALGKPITFLCGEGFEPRKAPTT